MSGDRNLRWGILGTAGIGAEFIRAARMSARCELRGVASRDRARAEAWAGRHDIPLAFGSYAELLASGQVDLVYNPLPNSLHAEWTIRALEAGCPVLCEKPFAVNAAQAAEVREVARQTGLHVAEAFMYRHHPLYAKLLELLRAGAIGEPASVHSQFAFLLDDPASISASPELAGGALLDVGCYCVHLSRQIAGCEPVRATALERRSAVDDTFMGILDFPNGFLASFEASIASAERHRAEIAGTTGTLVLERPWHPGDRQARLVIRRWGEPDEVVTVAGANPYFLQLEEFVEVCAGRAAPRWTVEDAVNNMAAIDALFLSAREGRVAEVRVY